MNKNLKIGLYVGLPILTITGYYLNAISRGKKLYKEVKKDAQDENSKNNSPIPNPCPKCAFKYKIITLLFNIRVHKDPSFTSKVVAKFKKGDKFYACLSDKTSWLKVYKVGYDSQYLKCPENCNQVSETENEANFVGYITTNFLRKECI